MHSGFPNSSGAVPSQPAAHTLTTYGFSFHKSHPSQRTWGDWNFVVPHKDIIHWDPDFLRARPNRSRAMSGHWHNETFPLNLIAMSADQMAEIMCSPSNSGPGLIQGQGSRRDNCGKAARVPFVPWLKGHFVEMKAVRARPLHFPQCGFSLTPFSFQ